MPRERIWKTEGLTPAETQMRRNVQMGCIKRALNLGIVKDAMEWNDKGYAKVFADYFDQRAIFNEFKRRYEAAPNDRKREERIDKVFAAIRPLLK